MPISVKQFNMKLTKEDLRRLDELSDKFGERHTQVMRRALNKFYDESKMEPKKHD